MVTRLFLGMSQPAQSGVCGSLQMKLSRTAQDISSNPPPTVPAACAGGACHLGAVDEGEARDDKICNRKAEGEGPAGFYIKSIRQLENHKIFLAFSS